MSRKNGDLVQDGRIDPGKVDVARPKRRRRKRNRPDPAPELRRWEKAAKKRASARPYPPNIMLEPAGFDEEVWTAPHSDPDLWMLQLADAFGTRSSAVISTFLRQLEALCEPRHWDDVSHQWRLEETEFSAALAIVNSVKPRNEIEACLAAQMVAVHTMQIKTSARAIKFESDTRTAVAAGKLARTFTQQIETLQALRGKRRTIRQSIKVSKELHQHVHYHRDEENDGQPHAPGASPTAQRPALPGPDEERKPLPRPSRKRKAGV